LSPQSEGKGELDPTQRTSNETAATETGRPSAFWEPLAGTAYRLAWWPAAPVVAAWMVSRSGLRPALARFGAPSGMAIPPKPVWIHAASVGEVLTSLPLIRALTERFTGLSILLTSATPTGMFIAQEKAEVPVCWFPVDQSLVLRRFFDRIGPRALVLLETELWPGLLRTAHARNIPVALVNGRLSDASASAYRKLALLWRPGVRRLSMAGMQTEQYAQRLIALGADPARVTVTGNFKYDAAPARLSDETARELRAKLGIASGVPVIVFGSTRPGDEALLAEYLPALFGQCPELRVIVAPRHLERIAEAELILQRWRPLRRTTVASNRAGDAVSPLILLDTYGELATLYRVADVAIVGGSFSGEVGGHNPIEPAAQGVPVLFGPDMRNFADIASLLVAEAAALQVPPQNLLATISQLLCDPARREAMGARAASAVSANRGSLLRTVNLIEPLLATWHDLSVSKPVDR